MDSMLKDVVNRSINQTLSRTVLTSGLTFLTVMSLYLFGGEVLRGFSFALVVGILIGTYSSIAVAAPMLVAYQDWRASRGKVAALPAARREGIYPNFLPTADVAFPTVAALGLVAAGLVVTGDGLVSAAKQTPGSSAMDWNDRLLLGLWSFRLEHTLWFTLGLVLLWLCCR
jgi:predicted RND superfamily exporter protein